jgi:hypothetical protein
MDGYIYIHKYNIQKGTKLKGKREERKGDEGDDDDDDDDKNASASVSHAGY